MGSLNDAPLQTSEPTSSPNSPGATVVSLTTPIRELSLERRESWVERIFARMSAMYGRLFADMWAGADLRQVKAAWAEDLGPFCGKQIAWAMEQCKARELPPTLPAFRNLCQNAPRPEAPALPAPRVPQEVAQERLHQLRKSAQAIAQRQDFLSWAKTPPTYGAAGSVWERMIIELAEAGDARFVAILRDHVAAGVIRSERGHAVLETGGADAAA